MRVNLRRNSGGTPVLMSVAVVMVALAMLSSVGCATKYENLKLDRNHPSIVYDDDRLLLGDRVVTPDEVLAILQHYEIPLSRPIHIKVTEAGIKNLHPARGLMGYLSHHGYHRVVLVTERHAEGSKARPDDVP